MSRDEIVPPTPEWLARHKGRVHIDTDHAGKFIGAAKKDTSVLAWLLRHGRIDDTHAYFVMVFLDMRERFRRRTGHSANRLYAAEFFGSDTSDGQFETIYLRVCRRIAGKTERMVSYAVEADGRFLDALHADPRVSAQRRLSEHCQALRDGFDGLIDAIERVRAEMKDAS